MTTTLIRTGASPEAVARLKSPSGHVTPTMADGRLRGRSLSCAAYKRRPMTVMKGRGPVCSFEPFQPRAGKSFRGPEMGQRGWRGPEMMTRLKGPEMAKWKSLEMALFRSGSFVHLAPVTAGVRAKSPVSVTTWQPRMARGHFRRPVAKLGPETAPSMARKCAPRMGRGLKRVSPRMGRGRFSIEGSWASVVQAAGRGLRIRCGRFSRIRCGRQLRSIMGSSAVGVDAWVASAPWN